MKEHCQIRFSKRRGALESHCHLKRMCIAFSSGWQTKAKGNEEREEGWGKVRREDGQKRGGHVLFALASTKMSICFAAVENSDFFLKANKMMYACCLLTEEPDLFMLRRQLIMSFFRLSATVLHPKRNEHIPSKNSYGFLKRNKTITLLDCKSGKYFPLLYLSE